MQLTPSQSKTLSTKRHLAITANAGSGKTRILVERYVNLFETHADLSARNVVAITFTENAGAELRTRILAEIKRRLTEVPRTETEQRRRLVAIRDGLPSAFIGTIHGFASRLIRAYPVESNVDSNFTILTGADQRIFLEEAMSLVFYTVLDEAYERTDETPILHLFRALGRRDVTGLVHALLRNRSRTAKLRATLLAKPNAAILDFWYSEMERLLWFISRESVGDLFSQLQARAKPGKRGQEIVPLFGGYFAATGFHETVCAFKELAAKLVTYRADRFDLGSLLPETAAAFETFLIHYEAILPLLKAWPASRELWGKQHLEYLALLRAVFDLLDLVAIEYESSKHGNALLDFDDLISKLERLLADQRVRGELVAQFRFIMIDEYQDTDASQYELARLLTENFGSRNNLTIVGDPKQSIYSFRNADSSVFQQTEAAIRAQTLSKRAVEESIELKLSPEEERGEISFRESFRMAEVPLAAINILFRSIMRTGDSLPFIADGPVHSDLILARSSPVRGSVEWICPAGIRPADASEDTQEDLVEDATEADLIARKILQMVHAPGDQYFLEDRGELRAARYDDIAILLRSRSGLPALERALRNAAIPYAVAKGAGFYSQQEILDISGYLTFLVTPSNDIALAGILRSPFFALSDVDLFQIAYHGLTRKPSRDESWTLWDKFQSYAEETKKLHLIRALEQLRVNRTLAGRTGAAHLIEKILAETGVFATLIAGRNGRQSVANLEKFLAQARASDTSGFSSLFDFVDRIQYLIKEDENESQADIAGEAGVVRVMTVHGAKGLEFPIVILPNLQKKFQFDNRESLDKELGLQIKLPESEDPAAIAEVIRLRARASTIAEEKRVFYVAATRARDHLVLSCTLPKKPPKDTWLSWAGEALPGAFDPLRESISVEERISRYRSDERTVVEEFLQFDIPLLRTEKDIPNVDQQVLAVSPLQGDVLFYLDPLVANRATGRFSATQFLRFKECPLKYHLSYVLGMPAEPKLSYDLEASELSEVVRGDLLGQMVHKLLDRIDAISSNGTLDKDRFDSSIDRILFDLRILNKDDKASYAATAKEHVQRALDSDPAGEFLTRAGAQTEFSLQARFETGDILYGIVDRLYQDSSGVWTVLDYKTERTNDPLRKSQNKLRYEFQLQFYAYLVHLLYPEQPAVRVILLYTASGESVEFNHDRTSFEGLRTEIANLIDAIRQNEQAVDLETIDRNLHHCPDCQFFDEHEGRCIALSAEALEADGYSSEVSEFA